jgi:hypothetical protein
MFRPDSKTKWCNICNTLWENFQNHVPRKCKHVGTSENHSEERTRMIRMIQAESSLWQVFHPTRRMEPRRKWVFEKQMFKATFLKHHLKCELGWLGRNLGGNLGRKSGRLKMLCCFMICVSFVNYGPLGLGGNLGWNSGIRMIRSEPRRKPRMGIMYSTEGRNLPRNVFPPLRSSCIRMIRPEPRRKPRMEMRSSKVSECCGGTGAH